MTPPIDLDAIRVRLDRATPGPWRYLGQGYIVHPGSKYDGCGVPDRYTRIPLCDADAALIAHAPEDLAALVDENERLRALATDLTGPHGLIVRQGDCEFAGKCSCGTHLGTLQPNQSFNDLAVDWERHVMLRHRGCECEECQL